ncbi:MAG: VWA domain-containing protein [Ignavibacteriales bacterium]|nr:VWA domain-containing protein [Ignavibacteriales bacterium]
MKYQTVKIILSIIIFSFCQNIFSTGALYVRPRFSTQQYEKMWIKTIDVNVDIQDQVAETHVDQIFYNEMNTSVEAIYLFPLPENAMITSMVYWFNGQRYEAEIRERQEAIADYNEKLSQWLDPALLEYLGDNLFRLSIVPVNALSEVRTEITYVELINYDFGVNNYKFLLNTLDLSSKPLETVHFNLDAKSQSPYKYFQSPSHENSSATSMTKVTDYNYTIEFGDENYFPDKDFILHYETIRDEVQFNVLTYTPTEEDSMGAESFYSLWITPPDSVSEDEVIPKDIIFTADVSSSMGGQRITQLKQSLDEFIDLLTPIDKFNIITFGTHIEKFKPDLVEANSSNVSAAHDFVYQIYALGMTNISEAFDSSLSQSFGLESSNNLIFLTDGKPTIGVTVTDSILTYAANHNKKGVRLFSFGIGENLSKTLLTQLSIQNHGYATYILEDENIAQLVNNHFTRISKPIITDLSLDFGGFVTLDKYPKTFLDLYWGSQTMELGLYPIGSSTNITLNGKIQSQAVQFTKTVEFPNEGGFRFVPRLWAKAKINHLLDLIDIYGETDELVEQILELSLQFQILTKYTAFYSDPTTSVKEDKDLIPSEFVVHQNYPNPFNPTTIISYSIPSSVIANEVKQSNESNSVNSNDNIAVSVKVYDILGRLVAVLLNDYQKPGNYSIEFDGSNLTSGIYYYTVSAGEFSITKKMVLVK